MWGAVESGTLALHEKRTVTDQVKEMEVNIRDVRSNYESQSPKRIIVQLQLNVSDDLDNVKFPFDYNLKIKDGNYNNYINYVIRII